MGEIAEQVVEEALLQDEDNKDKDKILDELSSNEIKELVEENVKVDKGVIKSKSKILDELRLKRLHTLVFGGQSMLGKSIITQKLAVKKKFRIIETEDKPFYFTNYKNQIHVNSWDELKREIFNLKEPVVVDSITKLYQDAMANTAWQNRNNIINDMLMLIEHIKLFGGVVVAHGETKVVKYDDIGDGSPENSVPEVTFRVEGNQKWLFRKTGLVIIGKHVLSQKRRLLFEGNHIPRKVFEIEIKKGSNGEPEVSGRGYDYLEYLMSNSIEILIQKGSK